MFFSRHRPRLPESEKAALTLPIQRRARRRVQAMTERSLQNQLAAAGRRIGVRDQVAERLEGEVELLGERLDRSGVVRLRFGDGAEGEVISKR